MKHYGIGLYFNGRNIDLNTRYISNDSSESHIHNSHPNDARHSLFDYDINIGIMRIHIIDLLKVNPNANWNVEEHFHPSFELHIIPYGKGTITIDGTTFEVGPRQFYLTGPYVKHEQKSNHENPMAEYCLQFEIKIPENGLENQPGFQTEFNSYRNILGTSYPRPFNDTYSVYSSFENIFDEVEAKDIAYELRVQTLVTDILINVMRSVSRSVNSAAVENNGIDGNPDMRVTIIRNFVESNYADKITIHDLKNILFLSTKQIDRIMMKECGMTFHGYLQKYRYGVAKKMISRTDTPLNEIALMTGLSGEGHLHKVFKKFDSNSPGYYRKK